MKMGRVNLRRSFFCAGFLFLGLAGPCHGQPSVAEIQRAQSVIEEEDSLRKKTEAEKKVFIRKVLVEGAAFLTEDEVREIVSGFEKHWLSGEDIRQVIFLLRKAYEDARPGGLPVEIAHHVQNKVLKITVIVSTSKEKE